MPNILVVPRVCTVTFAAIALWSGVAVVAPANAAPAASKASGNGVSNAAFPLRSRYLDVAVLETEDLNKRFDQIVVVDVRSKYEYDTLRVANAVLLPVTDKRFVDKVRALRAQSNKPIVFYCNGKTCAKSYDATLRAMSARIPEVYCYDAGIFDWAKAHPERAALLGRSPIQRQDLIDHEQFKSRLLAPKDFETKVAGGALVLDVRDRVQRDSPLFPFKESRAQLEETDKIDAIIEQAKREKKTLLVYDQVGKQVQWFQYYLERQGLKDYYFMKGGAQAWFDATYGKVVLGKGGE